MILEKYYDKLKIKNRRDLPRSLIDCYQVQCPVRYVPQNNQFNIRNIMLSPRATYLANNDGRVCDGFSACEECHKFFAHGHFPKFCIANNYFFGTTPECLLALSDIELALITPVKTHGYCFSYTGGKQKQLKGSLSYYKVKIDSIVRAVAHFEAVGLNEHVVVVLYGQMTSEQKTKAQNKNQIDTGKVLTAVRWLLANNAQWRQSNINLRDVIDSLTNPTLVESITEVSSDEQRNEYSVENTESFEIFFPDGTICPTSWFAEQPLNCKNLRTW